MDNQRFDAHPGGSRVTRTVGGALKLVLGALLGALLGVGASAAGVGFGFVNRSGFRSRLGSLAGRSRGVCRAPADERVTLGTLLVQQCHGIYLLVCCMRGPGFGIPVQTPTAPSLWTEPRKRLVTALRQRTHSSTLVPFSWVRLATIRRVCDRIALRP